jgi:hypothetical protein
MPSFRCPDCDQFVPVKWDAKQRCWKFWPHGPNEKRCTASGKLARPRGGDASMNTK